jgi:uncharacterized membrane protein
MNAQISHWLDYSWQILSYGNGRILVNLSLAFIPLLLSILLFSKYRSRSISWWFLFLIFVAFLPNAPYVLTDIVHVIDFIQKGYSIWVVTLLVIPQYFLFIAAGFQAYVLSLINLIQYVEKAGQKKYIWAVELSAHALCAVGVYLGRFERLNSWDFVTQPDNIAYSILDNFGDRSEIAIIFITFIFITLIYYLMKEITLSILFRWRYDKS